MGVDLVGAVRRGEDREEGRDRLPQGRGEGGSGRPLGAARRQGHVMTTPTATNTDPALRGRVAAALTGIGEEAGDVIARVAETEAQAGGNTGTAWTTCSRMLGRRVEQPEI